MEVLVALVVGAVIGTALHSVVGDPVAGGAPAQVEGISIDRGVAGPDAAVELAHDSIVQLNATGCGVERQASGTLVVDGVGMTRLVTNAHVVRGASTVSATRADGITVQLDVLGGISGRDAALLDPGPLLDAGAAAAPVGGVSDIGDPVTVVGYPAGVLRQDRTVVADVQRRAGHGAALDVILTGSPAQGGHSGGAVVDPTGSVVGLVAARDPGSGRVVAYRIDDVLHEPLGGMPDC